MGCIHGSECTNAFEKRQNCICDSCGDSASCLCRRFSGSTWPNHLAKITLITFEQLVFPDIEQEVVVFIGEKGDAEKGIRIIEMNDLSGFDALDLVSNGFQPVQHVKEKWTKYFINGDEMKLIQKLRADNRFAKFSEYGS